MLSFLAELIPSNRFFIACSPGLFPTPVKPRPVLALVEILGASLGRMMISDQENDSVPKNLCDPSSDVAVKFTESNWSYRICSKSTDAGLVA